MTLIPYTKLLSGAKQCQGCPKFLLKMSGLSSPSGHRCQLCKASLWYFTLFMVFPVRSATAYRVTKKKNAWPQKQPTPFYLCSRYFVANSIFGIIVISIRQFLATLSCFYSASSCLMLQLETRWLQQAIITSLFRSLPSSDWSAAVRTSPIPSFIVI